MNKKKLSWITLFYFIDVDLPIIAKLEDEFIINWQIIIGRDVGIDYENYVRLHVPSDSDSLKISFVYGKYRQRDPRLLGFAYNIVTNAKKGHPDLYYISGYVFPWGLPLYKLLLPNKKTVLACHNVSTPKGASNSKIASFNMNFILRNFKNLQVFSKSQHEELNKRCRGKNVLEAPLALKDYGRATITRKDNTIVRFLYFGIIRDYKRVDLLIHAGNILYERGHKGFRILIAGSCPEWEKRYANLIKYPEIFELNIRMIPNEDIANLFALSDYFVMPYQDIAQSGAITVAFQYNVPTIVSDIPQFKEFVEAGKTGLTFKSGDAVALADTMQYVLEKHSTLHPYLLKEQLNFVNRELSIESVVSKYKEYFRQL